MTPVELCSTIEHDHHHRGYPCDGFDCDAPPDDSLCAAPGEPPYPMSEVTDDTPRPVKVTVVITGRDGETTTYAMDAASAEEDRTQLWGHPLDVRFTFNDVSYRPIFEPPRILNAEQLADLNERFRSHYPKAE